MTPETNPYAAARRRDKAISLAALIRALGGDRHSAEALTKQEWLQLSDAARVNPPSEATKALVRAILERDAAARRKVEATV